MINKVGDAANSVADKIRSVLHFSVPDEGPLKDYESWMPDFMGGLAKGIENSKHLVSDSIKNMGSDIKVNTNAIVQTSNYNNQNNVADSNLAAVRSGITLNIENFYNNTGKDIENLANELDFYQRRLSMGRSGVEC
jgi:hypothetical protein